MTAPSIALLTHPIRHPMIMLKVGTDGINTDALKNKWRLPLPSAAQQPIQHPLFNPSIQLSFSPTAHHAPTPHFAIEVFYGQSSADKSRGQPPPAFLHLCTAIHFCPATCPIPSIHTSCSSFGR
jgi:hypothetical protein